MRHPAVQDCAVVGKPDALQGELPMAYVVVRGDSNVYEEELQQFLKGIYEICPNLSEEH